VLESLHTHQREASNQAQDIGEMVLIALNQTYHLGEVEYQLVLHYQPQLVGDGHATGPWCLLFAG